MKEKDKVLQALCDGNLQESHIHVPEYRQPSEPSVLNWRV